MRLILLLTAPALVQAQQVAIPPPDQDPFVGKWKANARKSRPKLDRKEASRDGEDLVFASSGGVSRAAIRQFRIRCDGLFHPLPAGPILSCMYVGANRVEGETKTPVNTDLFWSREVSPDGLELTISEYKDRARTKLRSVTVLDRIK